MSDGKAVALGSSMTAHQVLSGLYATLSDYTEYESLFEAFDQYLDEDFSPETSDDTWQKFFKQHFLRANEFFEKAHTDLETASRYVARQPVPAAVLNSSHSLLATNTLFDDLFPDADTARLIEELKSTKQWGLVSKLVDGKLDTPILIQTDRDNGEIEVLIISPIELLDETLERRTTCLALRLAKPIWKPQLEELLVSVYDLTRSEIEIIKSIFEVADLNLVAKRRGRSIRTVRTQLASIYNKMNVSGQTQLVILIASLLQFTGLDETHLDLSLDQDRTLPMRTANLRSGPISYTEYGDISGQPVLLISTSMPPEMNARFRDACSRAGLHIIAPYKPGSADTASRKRSLGPEALCHDYAGLLSHLEIEKAIIAGTASGGLYALDFAKAYPNRTAKVVLVDTGVPYASNKEIRALPKTMKRIMMTGRYMPDVLLAPHKIIAANFRRSKSGEARVIDYFFQDSPIDAELTRQKGEYYQLTRRTISYSFEDVPRLVSNICRWAKDWSPCLEAVAKTHKIAFVHGKENTMFRTEPITKFCQENDQAVLFEQANLGQLQIFVQPEAFTKAALS